MKAVYGVSHSPKTANNLLIRSRLTDFKLESTWAYEAPVQSMKLSTTLYNISLMLICYCENCNCKMHNVMSVISFSSVPDVSVSGTVCSLILTILHSLELLANSSYTIELISIPTMGLLSSIYTTTTST